MFELVSLQLHKWNRWEKLWAGSFILAILGSTLYFSFQSTSWDSYFSIFLNFVISPVSAITGVLCVLLVAQRIISNYFYGLIQCITYGYIAYLTGYYGDALLNIFFFLPFQFIGLFFWKKYYMEDDNIHIKSRSLTWEQFLIVLIMGAMITIGFGYFLNGVDNWFTEVMKRNVSIYEYIDKTFGIPYLGSMFDSSTETLQIFGQILMTLAFAEQWLFWILTNIITIIMWGTVIYADPTSVRWVSPILIMWIAFLINSIYGYILWKKNSKENN